MVFENNGKLRASNHLTNTNDSKSSYNQINKNCHSLCGKALIQVIREGKNTHCKN